MPTRKWKSEFLVNTTTAGNQDQSTVTALTDGGFMIGWRDDGPADSVIRVQRYDAAGLKVGTQKTIVPGITTPLDQLDPVLVTLSGGNVWVVQQDFDAPGDHDIEGQVITADGVLVRDQMPNSTSTANQVKPAAASLGTNGAVAVWQDFTANGGDIRMRGFNTDGNQRFAETVVNTNAGTLGSEQFGAAVSASPNGSKFVVTWHDSGLSGGVRARVFNSNGSQATAEFAVSALAPSIGNPNKTSVAWLDNNKFVASWVSFFGDGSSVSIKYAIYNADGSTFLAERLANSTTFDSQNDPVIAALPSGGFVIAWHDYSATGADDEGTAIRLQAFDSTGDKAGGEILVNTSTNGNQTDVALAALADGRVVVTWTDLSVSGGDVSGSAIRAQIVDPRDGNIDGTKAADTLYGHDSVGDIITGFGGEDTIYGLAGSDTISGGAGHDKIYAGKGDDLVYGDDGDDTLFAGPGDDLLDGGAGTDTASYADSAFGVTVALDGSFAAAGDGTGDVFVSIENLAGSAYNDKLGGNSGVNRISGLGGNDTIESGAGDTLVGGLGDDTYIVRSATVIIEETQLEVGNDTVLTSVSFDLEEGVAVETLSVLDPTTKNTINLYGNEFSQTITGNAGNNLISDGGAGNGDILIGLGGNDTYRVYDFRTDIVEAATTQPNSDKVEAAVSYTLGNGVYVEILTTTNSSGTSSILLHGNDIGQTITGNAGGNSLRGYGGDDTINGGNGNDRISGGSGNDTLVGGFGQDKFYFSNALNAATNVDKITDFDGFDDSIYLSPLIFTEAGPSGIIWSEIFQANETGLAADANDRIILNTEDGKLYYDPDGTGASAPTLFVVIGGDVEGIKWSDFFIG